MERFKVLKTTLNIYAQGTSHSKGPMVSSRCLKKGMQHTVANPPGGINLRIETFVLPALGMPDAAQESGW